MNNWGDFDIKAGDTVSFTLRGKIVTTVVKDVVKDEKTGEIRITTR